MNHLSRLDLRIVAIVVELEQPTLPQIATAAGILTPSACRTAARLISGGFLIKSTDPDDHRIIRYVATPSGIKLADSTRHLQGTTV